MKFIPICLLYTFHIHMNHHSNIRTNIFIFIVSTDRHVLRCERVEIYNIINGNEQWVLCICIAISLIYPMGIDTLYYQYNGNWN